MSRAEKSRSIKRKGGERGPAREGSGPGPRGGALLRPEDLEGFEQRSQDQICASIAFLQLHCRRWTGSAANR